MIGVGFRPEDDHNTILQEIVVLNRIRVQPLTFKVVDPGLSSQERLTEIECTFPLTPSPVNQLGSRLCHRLESRFGQMII